MTDFLDMKKTPLWQQHHPSPACGTETPQWLPLV